MLQAKELACVRGRRHLFERLSFAVHPGELLWVLGVNGSGKTSLLRILCALAPADSGEVSWHGWNARRRREEFHAELAYLGHAAAVKDDLSAAENLSFSLAAAGLSASTSERGHALREAGLARCADLPARVLSQGQRRRVSLARLACAAARPLWILDEPFTALDQASTAWMRQLLAAHLQRGGSVVLTSHQDVDFSGLSVQRLQLQA